MNNRVRTATVGLAVCAAAAFGAALAPVATAAPSDVTATPSVSGNNVTLTVTNNAAKRIGCEIVGVPAGGAVPGFRPPSPAQAVGAFPGALAPALHTSALLA